MDPITVEGGRRQWLAVAGSGRREVLYVAAVVLAVVVVAVGVWFRKAPVAIAPPAMDPAWSSPAPSVAATPDATLYVHVSGAVRKPGLYRFPEGSRIVDAIEAAGGARDDADLGAINLAELLVDATKVEVPVKGEAPTASAAPAAGASPAPSLVNLNTADQAALETIPGVGPVTATSILVYRDEVGSFSSVDQLLEVDGIGPATLESLLPYVTI